MADNINISTVLKRSLRSGKEYDKLIPTVKCERTPLGKGDTFFTVDRMKDWIEKYRYQTAKIALKLEGHTVEETVNNIYNFLYNHVQYTADGSLQQLRSPACTWMQRKQGVDCKSYSVFASCILSNLGIKYAIRQVRQTYFYPEEFTHVYVVVFKDQSEQEYPSNAPTFVLDATKHENTEVNYIEKVDLYMNKLAHVGLNAPQDERTATIIQNFNKFCQFLLAKGASANEVNAIRLAVSNYTSVGKDPRINLVYDGVQIEGVIYEINLTEYVPFLTIRNAFYGGRSVGLNGLGFSFGDAFKDFSGQVQAFSSNTQNTQSSQSTNSGGDITGGIIEAGATALAPPPFGSLIAGILGKLELSKNISNVLKYGLSSWGASKTPEDKKARFAEIVYPWLQEQIAKTTIHNIDHQITLIDANLRANAVFYQKLMENHSRAKSTRLANEWSAGECNRLLEETMAAFNKKLQESSTKVSRRKVSAKSSEILKYPVFNFGNKNDLRKDRYWDLVDYYIYEVDKSSLKNWNNQGLKPQLPVNNQNAYSPTQQPQTVGNGNSYQEMGSEQQIPGGGAVPKAESSNTGVIVAVGVGLAALPFLLPLINKKTMPAPKKPAQKSQK